MTPSTTFPPDPGSQIEIEGILYTFCEHPAAPGMVYGQSGRAGTVFQLNSPQGLSALKVFNQKFRKPWLVRQADQASVYANLPGLEVCRRLVLTPSRHEDLLKKYSELTYAILMPWVDGPTWQSIMLENSTWRLSDGLAASRSLARAMLAMEEQGVAHCDLSGANIILRKGGVAFVDVEGMYASELRKPDPMTSSSPGYAHQTASDGIWQAEADRFSGAVLIAEMLGWGLPEVRGAAWGESYFEPGEMQSDSPRWQLLYRALQDTLGEALAVLMQRAWQSDSVSGCPTFAEWLLALPVGLPTPVAAAPVPVVEIVQPNEEPVGVGGGQLTAAQQLMQAAQRKQAGGDQAGALRLYRAVLDLEDVPLGQRREVEALIATFESPQPAAVVEKPSAEGQRRLKWWWLAAPIGILVMVFGIIFLLPKGMLPTPAGTATTLPAADIVLPVVPTDTVMPAMATQAVTPTLTPELATLTPTLDLGLTQTMVALDNSASGSGASQYTIAPDLSGIVYVFEKSGSISLSYHSYAVHQNLDEIGFYQKNSYDDYRTIQCPSRPWASYFSFSLTTTYEIPFIEWSPNSKYIAYILRDLHNEPILKCTGEYSVEAVSEQVITGQTCVIRNIANSKQNSFGHYCSDIKWSEDGRYAEVTTGQGVERFDLSNLD